eukprot:223203-Alexandrium_andersonii.AAC.1
MGSPCRAPPSRASGPYLRRATAPSPRSSLRSASATSPRSSSGSVSAAKFQGPSRRASALRPRTSSAVLRGATSPTRA